MRNHASGLRVLIAVAVVVLAGSTLLISPRPASAQDVPVTVTIKKFIEHHNPDRTITQGGAGDYYARVEIDGNQQDNRSDNIAHESEIEPGWMFTENVDPSGSATTTVVIEIIDADSTSVDDVMDINPEDGVLELTLSVDLATGDWSGDVSRGEDSSRGDGDTDHTGVFEGGEEGEVFFDISTSGDSDGDGLLDDWEENGLDVDGDGEVDVDLPAMGADPMHKDLFLEFDWVSGAEPDQDEIQKMKDAFAAAPVDAGGTPNPDGEPGINLWVDTGDLTDSSGDLVGDDLGGGNELEDADGDVWSDDICNLNSDFYDAKSSNFDDDRSWVFRYGISAPGCDNDGDGRIDSGGWGEIGGNDFIEYNHDGGTIMHELGHTLNLRHGGDENANCKPGYVSVMNYDNQFRIRQVGGDEIIDFSPPRFNGDRGTAPLAPLDESDLDESTALDSDDDTNQFVYVNGNGNKVRSQLDQPVDWNGDGDTDDSGLSVNTDTAGSSGNPSACQNSSSSDTLTGHHDWDVISIPFRQFGDADDGPINPVEDPEITLQEMLEVEQQLHSADLAIEKSDSDDPVVAGQNVAYTLTVTNNGPNPAQDVRVVDTLPAGISNVGDDAGCTHGSGELVCNLGELLVGERAEIQITADVDADLVFSNDGPVTITNEASARDLAEFADDPNPDNSTVSEDTDVVAEADLEVGSFEAVDVPDEILIGEPVEIDLEKTITNNGPSTPIDVAIDVNATASGDATATPDPDNPEQALALELGENRSLTESVALACESPGEHTFTVENSISPLNSSDNDPNPDNNSAAEEVTVDCVVPVSVEVKSSNGPSPVNLRGRGVVPVTVLTTDAGEDGLPLTFDATTIDPLSVTFGPPDELFNTEASGSSERHGRGHGGRDMMLHFPVQGSGLEPGDTQACVKGEFTDEGETFTFFGCDSITTRPGR